jgi:hypothetical protein
MQVAPEPDLAEIEEGANADFPSPGEKVTALEGALAKLGELIAAVEQARPAAEEARLAADEVFARLESVAGILVNPAYATLSDDYRAAGVLMDAGAFVAAQSAYVALIEPGNALHASLTRPPRMTCDVEEIPGGMRQVDEGVYPLGDLVTSRRFQDNVGSRLGLADEQIEVAQFCIQARPLLLSELGGFVADIRQDPMSFSKLPETMRNPKNPAAPVSGLSRVIVDQYARWLSEKTGRVVRLPTLAELLVADSLAERKEGEAPDNKLVWTAEQCTSQFGLIAMVAKNPRLSTTECRLMLSNLHSDVYVRLVLEAGPPAEAKSGEEAAGRSDVGN